MAVRSASTLIQSVLISTKIWEIY